MIKQLKKFIKDNDLEFNAGSGGDSNILALCGYALFIGASVEDCIKVADNSDCDFEIERIYEYGERNNYAAFWKTPIAKEQYVF